MLLSYMDFYLYQIFDSSILKSDSDYLFTNLNLRKGEMNFNKGHNVFSDIPGFDASKGERIVKALQRLWGKIEHLEKVRISEKKSRSKEVQTSSKDEDLTITDVQYKLLVLQLQYARSILRKKLDKGNVVSHAQILEGGQNAYVYDGRNNRRNFELYEDFQGKAVSHETQTGSSLIEEFTLDSDIPKNVTKVNAQVSTDSLLYRSEGLPEHSTSVTSKIHQTSSKLNSKPHYHLKLDDVPFILGASSTASHSVVANVQNIIAMMKSHNKALCGPKHHISRSSAVNTQSVGGDSQDATKMLNELSQDLYELALKQEKLVKRFDAAQGKNQASNLIKNFHVEDKNKRNKSSDVKNDAVRRRSNSESSIKLHAEVKNFSKMKKDVRYNVQQKQNLTTTRSQSTNLPVMARRKLLRSLQNFKTHLSEEDISWD